MTKERSPSGQCPWGQADKCGPLRQLGLVCPCALEDLKDLASEAPVSFVPAAEASVGVAVPGRDTGLQCQYTRTEIRSLCGVESCKWHANLKHDNNCLLAAFHRSPTGLWEYEIAQVLGLDPRYVEIELRRFYQSQRAGQYTGPRHKPETYWPQVAWGQSYPAELLHISTQIGHLVKDLR